MTKGKLNMETNGLVMQGLLAGELEPRQIVSQKTGEVFEFRAIGIKCDVPDGCGGTDTKTIQIELPKLEPQELARILGLRDQLVAAPVYVDCYATKFGASYRLKLSKQSPVQACK